MIFMWLTYLASEETYLKKKHISNVEILAVSSRFYLANYTWLSIIFVTTIVDSLQRFENDFGLLVKVKSR